MSASEFQRQPEPRSTSLTASIVDNFVVLCRLLPYALAGLALRLIMARVFFLSGQPKIAGPVIQVPLPFADGPFPVTLPAEIRQSTFELFAKDYAALPMSPTTAAHLFSYAEFVLPICLVLGFATRISALALFVLTALIQLYVAPEALWTAHIYLFAILLVLMSVGPGAISADALIRALYRK